MVAISRKALAPHSFYRALRRYVSKFKTTQAVFTEIYRGNKWGGKDSVSGTGSNFDQTRVIARELPALFADFEIKSMLDIPCGDFHWMKNVDLGQIDYTGADIVKEIVRANRRLYARSNRRFQCLNLINGKLPQVDLVFSRDCLVHLCFQEIARALENILRSKSRFFLATTFPSRDRNEDIPTGKWRVLNLERAPFFLPKPMQLIYEGCSECGGAYEDKALGLWRISDLPQSMALHGSV